MHSFALFKLSEDKKNQVKFRSNRSIHIFSAHFIAVFLSIGTVGYSTYTYAAAGEARINELRVRELRVDGELLDGRGHVLADRLVKNNREKKLDPFEPKAGIDVKYSNPKTLLQRLWAMVYFVTTYFFNTLGNPPEGDRAFNSLIDTYHQHGFGKLDTENASSISDFIRLVGDYWNRSTTGRDLMQRIQLDAGSIDQTLAPAENPITTLASTFIVGAMLRRGEIPGETSKSGNISWRNLNHETTRISADYSLELFSEALHSVKLILDKQVKETPENQNDIALKTIFSEVLQAKSAHKIDRKAVKDRLANVATKIIELDDVSPRQKANLLAFLKAGMDVEPIKDGVTSRMGPEMLAAALKLRADLAEARKQPDSIDQKSTIANPFKVSEKAEAEQEEAAPAQNDAP